MTQPEVTDEARLNFLREEIAHRKEQAKDATNAARGDVRVGILVSRHHEALNAFQAILERAGGSLDVLNNDETCMDVTHALGFEVDVRRPYCEKECCDPQWFDQEGRRLKWEDGDGESD